MQKLQAALTEFLMEHARIEHEANLYEFKDEPTGKVFRTASSLVVGAQPKFYAVYTLGSVSNNVFLTLADRDMSEIARILASLEDYDESNDSILHAGDTVILDSEYLRGKGFARALLLRPSSSNVFLSIPDSAEFFGKKICFLLVLLISNQEYQYKKKHGYDALLEKLDQEHRGFVYEGSIN